MKWQLVPTEPTLDAAMNMTTAEYDAAVATRDMRPLDDAELVQRVARAVHAERIKWGWKLGIRKGPLAIDYEMARAAIAAIEGGR